MIMSRLGMKKYITLIALLLIGCSPEPLLREYYDWNRIEELMEN